MNIKMLQTRAGCHNGHDITYYYKGKTYEDVNDWQARKFFRDNVAIRVQEVH